MATASTQQISVSLQGGPPWGFRLLQDFGSKSLKVSKLRKYAKAEAGGLREGDVMIKVNGVPTVGMTVENAVQLIQNSGNDLRIEVQRGAPFEGSSYAGHTQTMIEPTPSASAISSSGYRSVDFSTAPTGGPTVNQQQSMYASKRQQPPWEKPQSQQEYASQFSAPPQMHATQPRYYQEQAPPKQGQPPQYYQQQQPQQFFQEGSVVHNIISNDPASTFHDNQQEESFHIPGMKRDVVREATKEEIEEMQSRMPELVSRLCNPELVEMEDLIAAKRRKKMFADSAFYDDSNKNFPTIEEQVALCRKIARSLDSNKNKEAKGFRMFENRKQRSSKWTLESGPDSEDTDEIDSSQQDATNEDRGAPETGRRPQWTSEKLPGQADGTNNLENPAVPQHQPSRRLFEAQPQPDQQSRMPAPQQQSRNLYHEQQQPEARRHYQNGIEMQPQNPQSQPNTNPVTSVNPMVTAPQPTARQGRRLYDAQPKPFLPPGAKMNGEGAHQPIFVETKPPPTGDMSVVVNHNERNDGYPDAPAVPYQQPYQEMKDNPPPWLPVNGQYHQQEYPRETAHHQPEAHFSAPPVEIQPQERPQKQQPPTGHVSVMHESKEEPANVSTRKLYEAYQASSSGMKPAELLKQPANAPMYQNKEPEGTSTWNHAAYQPNEQPLSDEQPQGPKMSQSLDFSHQSSRPRLFEMDPYKISSTYKQLHSKEAGTTDFGSSSYKPWTPTVTQPAVAPPMRHVDLYPTATQPFSPLAATLAEHTSPPDSQKPRPMSLGDLEQLRLTKDRCYHNQIDPKVAFGIAHDLKASHGKAGNLFAKRRERAEKFTIDEETVKKSPVQPVMPPVGGLLMHHMGPVSPPAISPWQQATLGAQDDVFNRPLDTTQISQFSYESSVPKVRRASLLSQHSTTSQMSAFQPSSFTLASAPKPFVATF